MDRIEQEIRAAEERLRAAMLSNDVAALGELLHDDLLFTGPDGSVVGKADDLAAHRARRLRLRALTLEDLELTVEAAGVVVTVQADLIGTFDGTTCDGRYRYTRIWRKTAGRWQIIGGRVTPDPG